ncbi:MAG TPA: cyclic nucleotide-binding domain-containing protein [Acidimicrobiia bacterium]|nr:cyclic nucleotide-binding domain-containing protein [Acidimicrobiia bacterium]
MSNFFVGCTNDQLREVELFADLDEATLDDLKMHSHFIGAHPGLHIIRQDGAGFDLYVILSGEAEVRRNNEVLATLGKGNVFGEMALLSSHHRNADVVAKSVMSMMTMTADDFQMMTKKYPEIERRIRQMAEARQNA